MFRLLERQNTLNPQENALYKQAKIHVLRHAPLEMLLDNNALKITLLKNLVFTEIVSARIYFEKKDDTLNLSPNFRLFYTFYLFHFKEDDFTKVESEVIDSIKIFSTRRFFEKTFPKNFFDLPRDEKLRIIRRKKLIYHPDKARCRQAQGISESEAGERFQNLDSLKESVKRDQIPTFLVERSFLSA